MEPTVFLILVPNNFVNWRFGPFFTFGTFTPLLTSKKWNLAEKPDCFFKHHFLCELKHGKPALGGWMPMKELHLVDDVLHMGGAWWREVHRQMDWGCPTFE